MQHLLLRYARQARIQANPNPHAPRDAIYATRGACGFGFACIRACRAYRSNRCCISPTPKTENWIDGECRRYNSLKHNGMILDVVRIGFAQQVRLPAGEVLVSSADVVSRVLLVASHVSEVRW